MSKDFFRKPESTRLPATPSEERAALGIVQLVQWDLDYATEKNGIGFNSAHTVEGHILADKLVKGQGLTDSEWSRARWLCYFYRGQICPVCNAFKDECAGLD